MTIREVEFADRECMLVVRMKLKDSRWIQCHSNGKSE
jgi:hypothetical protein